MPRSMTGFGRGQSSESGKEFQVELKTINHRYVDIGIKLPRQLTYLEEKVREYLMQHISRGKVDAYITYDDKSESSRNVSIDQALAGTYVKSLQQMRDAYGLADDITVGLVARFPDVLKVEKCEEDEELIWKILSNALEDSVQSLLKMREHEGQELKKDLIMRAEAIKSLLAEIIERAPLVVQEYKARLETRVKDIMEQKVIDENRMAMEIAIFADRCSIDEEIVRLTSHIEQMKQTLDSTQPVGRKLDFLVQEMNREANTIGSKANDLKITQNVVEIKSEIEKIREQVQNLE